MSKPDPIETEKKPEPASYAECFDFINGTESGSRLVKKDRVTVTTK